MADKSVFLDAIEKVSQSDLDSIQADIDELERQLEKRRSQKKIARALLGVPPVRRGTKKKSPGDAGDTATRQLSGNSWEKRMRVAKSLLNGPRRIADICEELDLPPQGFSQTINCEWFGKTADGSIHLTSAGRAAAAGKAQHA